MPSDSKERTTLKLTRKEVDFPLGIGKDIVDVEIGFEWVTTTKPDGDGEPTSAQEAAPVEPPNREDALSPQGKGNILTSAVQGAASGETTGGIRGVVEATQAVES